MSAEISTGQERPQSILLAEDNAADRRGIADFLVGEGYYVIEAENGMEALQYIREMEPDIILSDLRLPELDGLELLRRVRAEFPATPFILISGYGTLDDVILGLRQGAWDYLTKPIVPLELLGHSLAMVREKAHLQEKIYRQQEYLEELVERRTMDLLTQNRNYQDEIKRRERMEEQARLAEAEWRRTVDALPEMIAIIDRDRKIVRLNKAMLDFLGKPEEEVVGTSCLMCSGDSACLHGETIRDNIPRTKEIVFEQERRNIELKIIPFSSEGGEWLGSIHIFRDITEQKRRERAKQLMQTKALHDQKMESVGQLASGIAHEINTPTQFVSSNIAFFEEAFNDIRTSLRAILAAASQGSVAGEVIAGELEKADWEYLEEEIPAALQQSREGLNRVSSIVRAMKEFSHPGDKETEAVDINNVINVTVTVARNEWKYVAEVDLRLSPDLPKVYCLSDEMGQVILNLLVNAAHAIEEKIGENPEVDKGTIIIETFTEGPWAVIRLSDTGCGMPQGLIDKIFDPFFTTKSVGKGTGQGLAIAHDVVVNKHSGSIRVDSSPGRGTTFTIELPLPRRGEAAEADG